MSEELPEREYRWKHFAYEVSPARLGELRAALDAYLLREDEGPARETIARWADGHAKNELERRAAVRPSEVAALLPGLREADARDENGRELDGGALGRALDEAAVMCARDDEPRDVVLYQWKSLCSVAESYARCVELAAPGFLLGDMRATLVRRLRSVLDPAAADADMGEEVPESAEVAFEYTGVIDAPAP